MLSDEACEPYDRPPLSKSFLTEQEEKIPFIANDNVLTSNAIKLVQSNPVIAIDRIGKFVTLADDQTIRYEKLLIATGARPRCLSLPGSDSPKVHYLRSVNDAIAIKRQLKPDKHVIIIGGGFLGLEIASSARKLGVAASIIEGLPRLLSRGVPTEIAEIVASKHRDEGVTIHLGAQVTHLSQESQSVVVHLASGQHIQGDIVVAGIGSTPNTDLASKAGLKVNNGISVDEYLCTCDPDIYAAGDCVSFPLPIFNGSRVRLESWRNAQDQGIVVAANMLGKQEAYVAIPWFWSDQYDLSLQITGQPGSNDMSIRRDLGNDAFILFHINESGRLTGASGIGPGNTVARDIRLAEMLIIKHISPTPEELANPELGLKKLLKSV